MSEPQNMSNWQAFAGTNSLISMLRDINLFQFRAEIPMTVIWANDEVRYRVAQLVYDEVVEVLRVSGLFQYDQLSILASDDQILVRYMDDKYAFEVGLRNEYLTITRQGSAFDRFHRWYVEVAPHFAGLVERIAGSIEEAIRSVTNLDRRMPVHDASYSFRFILYDFIDEDDKPLLNAEVLEDLLPRCPGDVGSLSATEAQTGEIARLDANFHKWRERDGRLWTETYNVEAPSNRDWSSVWVTFGMSGRSFERPADGARLDFEAMVFISDYVTPLVEFLRDRGLMGFLSSLVGTRKFSTTAAQLP